MPDARPYIEAKIPELRRMMLRHATDMQVLGALRVELEFRSSAGARELLKAVSALIAKTVRPPVSPPAAGPSAPTPLALPLPLATPAGPRADRHRRKQSNVRLSDAARRILADAVVQLGVSQAAVVELALRRLAEVHGIAVAPASRPQSRRLLDEVRG